LLITQPSLTVVLITVDFLIVETGGLTEDRTREDYAFVEVYTAHDPLSYISSRGFCEKVQTKFRPKNLSKIYAICEDLNYLLDFKTTE
jgi:hypothetical protein